VPAVPGRFALLFICLSRCLCPLDEAPRFTELPDRRTCLLAAPTLILLYSASRQRQTRPPPHRMATQDERRTRTNYLFSGPHRLCLFVCLFFPFLFALPLYSLTVLANSSLTHSAPPRSDNPFLSFCFIVFLFVLTIFIFYSFCAPCQCATTTRLHPLCFSPKPPPSPPLLHHPQAGH